MSCTLQERVTELVTQHGSLRAAARVLECDPGYLSRLQSGEKDSPEDWLLRRMGLRRVVTYERADNAPKSLLRQPLKPGERLVCYCPPGVCQAPKGFSGPCNRATDAGVSGFDQQVIGGKPPMEPGE